MAKVKQTFMILAILGCFVLAGCQSTVRTREQQLRKYDRITNINARLMQDDIDTILMADEPSQLTSWVIPFE